ncbi:hypothetical protein [Methanolobus chelungpuianus]|uniref:hypothetical protein n=1 Tax=Methanolobus chelungpuianus TaxID=502115 RepID=UPI002114E169|nr:hypothetical protein [Methanolobus chelungpuianus]
MQNKPMLLPVEIASIVSFAWLAGTPASGYHDQESMRIPARSKDKNRDKNPHK